MSKNNSKFKANTVVLIIISILFITSCEKVFDYSPYVIDFDEENTNTNSKNIQKIISSENSDDTIIIAFTGDSHLEYDEFDEIVNTINNLKSTINFDFAVHMGDIADFGLPKQYLWANKYLLNLDIPYVVTLGNHDLVGNGGDAYKEMFGEFDFSFIYDSIKFISLNTNGMEFSFNGNVPDISWLDSQLKPNNNFAKAVLLIHVPPTNRDFDSSLEIPFQNTITKYNNVICVVHGHTHHHSVYVPYEDSMSYIGIYSMKKKKFNILKIVNNKFSVSTYELK